MDTILGNIKKTIAEVADIPIEEISADSLIIDDLDLSSIEIMAMVGETERIFAITIKEGEMLSIRTVGELAKLVEIKLAK